MTPWRIPYPKFGDGPGLERVAAVAARLGIDLARFGETGSVIVGSNGKGSTAAMTAALLSESGKSVGLFTSPHLFDLNERFRLDGEDITDAALLVHWERVRAAIDAAGLTETVGGFEFLFLIAADWFAAQGCTYTVWEAGLGGRLDPVRLIEARRVALTALDLEHTALLGDTIEAIAQEKMAATPPHASLFVGESCAPYRETIEAFAQPLRIRTSFTTSHAGAPLTGVFQRENAALALALARELVSLRDEQVTHGFAATRWPGRLEVIDEEPLAIIDVGHTPAGVRAALAGFGVMKGERTGVLVCGASVDKDVSALIGVLAPAFGAIICTAASHKGAPAAQVAASAAAANPQAEIVIAESVADARRLARHRAAGKGAAIYVAGGLFLAAEYKAVSIGRDPSTLAFF